MPSLSIKGALRAAVSIASVSFAFTVLTSINPANAKILMVGDGQQYTSISAAAKDVRSGDTINVMPGNYGCADFGAYNNFTIQGVGASPVVSGGICSDKGLFVFGGNNITVKNMTFQGAFSVYDGNGAGIRFLGQNLNVVNSKFQNNQNGILTIWNVGSTINVTGSEFDGNGTCAGSGGCGHGIYAGHVGQLNVTNSTFTNTQEGHDIKSRANRTYVVGNTITDGPTGTSSYLIDVPDGGAVTIAGNTLEKGAKSSNPTTAIAIAEESNNNPKGAILIANNTFQNDGQAYEFVWNRSGHSALIAGNVLTGNQTKVLQGVGTVSAAHTVVSILADSGMYGDGGASSGTEDAGSPTGAVPVPEPNSLALVASALAALFLVTGARRKS